MTLRRLRVRIPVKLQNNRLIYYVNAGIIFRVTGNVSSFMHCENHPLFANNFCYFVGIVANVV